jgi:hypothetical protein
MLSHDLANELLALPNMEVSYADDDELLPVDSVEEEDGEIILCCDDDDDDEVVDEGNVIDVPFKAIP